MQIEIADTGFVVQLLSILHHKRVGLAAVTIGGGVGGLVGVLLSVPVASVLYALLRRDVHKRLACKE